MARAALKEAFGPECFYCSARLASDNPVDHVLLLSRVGIDGLANLVLACRSCNGDKLNARPVAPARRRGSGQGLLLEQIADRISWPTQRERVLAAARGIYRGGPAVHPPEMATGRRPARHRVSTDVVMRRTLTHS